MLSFVIMHFGEKFSNIPKRCRRLEVEFWIFLTFGTRCSWWLHWSLSSWEESTSSHWSGGHVVPRTSLDTDATILFSPVAHLRPILWSINLYHDGVVQTNIFCYPPSQYFGQPLTATPLVFTTQFGRYSTELLLQLITLFRSTVAYIQTSSD